jgi:DNA-binding NtrC family response regulator
MKAPRILIVDDEEDFTFSLRKVLMRRGYHVEVASDGLSGLSLVNRESFSLVILDYKMPGMNGGRLLSEIHRLTPCTPTILLTGQYSLQGEEVIGKNAFAHLLKPYPIPDLIRVIAKALENGVTVQDSPLPPSCMSFRS